MALNLKKIAAARSGAAGDASPDIPPLRKNVPAQVSPARWHGRPTPPPPRGSTWDDYVEWASESSFYPSDEDIALAMRFWRGLEPRENDDAQAPAP